MSHTCGVEVCIPRLVRTALSTSLGLNHPCFALFLEWILLGGEQRILPASLDAPHDRWVLAQSTNPQWCSHCGCDRFRRRRRCIRLPLSGWVGGQPKSLMWRLVVLQGVSQAGLQCGLMDPRTALLPHSFRAWDGLKVNKRRVVLLLMSSVYISSVRIATTRRLMLLENVASILQKKDQMCEIIKNSHKWIFACRTRCVISWNTFFRTESLPHRFWF